VSGRVRPARRRPSVTQSSARVNLSVVLDADRHAEADLLAAVGRGDDAAFAVLYRRYLPLVLRWCWRETRNRELAADLSAEVFAAALTSCRRYRPEQGSIGAWLLGIAQNKLRESRRRGRVEDAARRRLRVEPTTITDLDLERVVEIASLNGDIIALLNDLPAARSAASTDRERALLRGDRL
jgi:RNA polymerase sigma factor (sigma-70 family)